MNSVRLGVRIDCGCLAFSWLTVSSLSMFRLLCENYEASWCLCRKAWVFVQK